MHRFRAIRAASRARLRGVQTTASDAGPDISISAADSLHLKRCIALAREAASRGDVPVAALITGPCGAMLAEAKNAVVGHNATAHAEMRALAGACNTARAHRLDGCTVYVSLEPCVMPVCYGAMLLHRIRRVVYCTSSPKFGAISLGVVALLRDRANHEAVVLNVGGELGAESAGVLKDFFASRRSQRPSDGRESDGCQCAGSSLIGRGANDTDIPIHDEG